MKNISTKNTTTGGLVMDGLKVAGDSVGLKASRRKIKNEVQQGFSLINQLNEMLFTRKGKESRKEIELAGLGVMAAYHLYQGLEKKRKAPLLKGVFLAGVLVTALIVNHNVKSNAAPTLNRNPNQI